MNATRIGWYLRERAPACRRGESYGESHLTSKNSAILSIFWRVSTIQDRINDSIETRLMKIIFQLVIDRL